MQRVDDPEGNGQRLTVRLSDATDARARLSQAVVAQGGIIVAMQHQEISLEEAFVTITERDILTLVGQGGAEAAQRTVAK